MRATRLWTWQLAAGLIVLVLLGLHMLVTHLDQLLGWFTPPGVEATAWASVLARSETTFFAVTYVILLGAALYHGLYGLRTILVELWPNGRFARALAVLFWTGGGALFVLGTYAALAVRLAAAAAAAG